MNVIYQLVRRHTLVFLRDKASVFFSFFSVIIIILLYVLFLGKLNVDSLSDYAGSTNDVKWLVNSWIMAGILTVTTITIPLGVLATLIKDRETGIMNDFYTAPINRNQLALSYLISSWVIGFILVFANLIIGQIYIVVSGGHLLGFIDFFQLIVVILLSIISFTSFFFYIALFMKTQRSFGLLTTLVGTFVGFLGGIYIQIGMMGETMRLVMKLLPSMHSVSLVRSIYMTDSIDVVFEYATATEITDYQKFFGIIIELNGHIISNIGLALLLGVFGLVFYLLSVLKLKKTKL